MRIAQVAPLHESVPPKLHGGIERVVSYLTEELVDLGHDVTLFATGDSRTAAKLVPVWPGGLRRDPAIRDAVAPHMLLMEMVRRRAGDFDVIHFHTDYWPFSVFTRQSTPFVTTLHGHLDLPEMRPLLERFSDVAVVSISNHQRRAHPAANYVRTVQYGLPTELFAPRQRTIPPEYLAFLGHLAPEKGPDRAIRIARASGIPLKIAAKVSETDRPYFENVVRPLLAGGGVELVGEISDAEKPAFLAGAAGLLMPIDRPEPFDLAMIEAMARGTPVVAFYGGSVPEVVEDGLTGFIVSDESEAVRAIDRLRELSRARIRRRFIERFTARRMASEYLDVYRSLIVGQGIERAIPVLRRQRLAPLSSLGRPEELARFHMAGQRVPASGPTAQRIASAIVPADLAAP